MTAVQHVTVLGTGVLGSQIAFQTAFSGVEVVAYDISAEAIDLLQAVVDRHLGGWRDDEVARFATDLTRFNDAASDGDRPWHPETNAPADD